MIDINIINIVNTDKTKELFFNDIKKIYEYSKTNDVYLAIDFEFNTKKVALMQMLFQIKLKINNYKQLSRNRTKYNKFLNISLPEDNMEFNKIIEKYYIIYPPNLNKDVLNFLKKKILGNQKILKILHGAESLDVPYIIYELFDFNIKLIINFFLSMIDTRYLCEYINIYNNKHNICSLYDMLCNFNIIDANTKKKLDNNEKKMGPIYNIIINIDDLSTELIIYAIHDVVFLIKAYKILKTIIISNKIKLPIIKIKEYDMLLEFIRYAYLEKKNIIDINNLFILNKMNNYFINNKNFINNIFKKINNDKKDIFSITLIKIYNIILDKYRYENKYIDIILNINYLKTDILNLLRNIVYIIIDDNYEIYASKNILNKYCIKENYNIIIEYFRYLKLDNLLIFTDEFKKYVSNYLIKN